MSNCHVSRKRAIHCIIGEEAKKNDISSYDLPSLLKYPVVGRVKSMLVDVIDGLPVGKDKQHQTDIDDVIFLALDFVISVAVRAQKKLRELFCAIDVDKSGEIYSCAPNATESSRPRLKKCNSVSWTRNNILGRI